MSLSWDSSTGRKIKTQMVFERHTGTKSWTPDKTDNVFPNLHPRVFKERRNCHPSPSSDSS